MDDHPPDLRLEAHSGSAQAFGNATLKLSASGTVAVTAAVVGSASVVAATTLTATGTVGTGTAFGQVATYISSLAIPDLMVVWGWAYSEVRDALQDPRSSMFSLLITLPILALVLHRLNQRH